jgi:hypothetical protein
MKDVDLVVGGFATIWKCADVSQVLTYDTTENNRVYAIEIGKTDCKEL